LAVLDNRDNTQKINENNLRAVDPPLASTSNTEERFMANMANPFGYHSIGAFSR
jgi:hypothetical protein